MALRGTREATHAGSWYQADPNKLQTQFKDFFEKVPAAIDGEDLPVPGARVIIAPHAGYTYSGPCAAWAYKCLDVSKAKRVFIFGPSHTYYLRGCALTKFATFETPFGNFPVDADVVGALRQTGKFSDIPAHNDEEEHSLEMHLPFLWKRLEETHGQQSEDWPTIVPVMIGDNDGPQEKSFAELLLPYLKDAANAFLVSSDFCHWGRHFGYYGYVGVDGKADSFTQLTSKDVKALDSSIHEGIKRLDQLSMDAVASGKHEAFVDNLRATHNTVCGRHPIGVVMAALEMMGQAGHAPGANSFRFVQYQRSTLVERFSETSVSYAAAYAVP